MPTKLIINNGIILFLRWAVMTMLSDVIIITKNKEKFIHEQEIFRLTPRYKALTGPTPLLARGHGMSPTPLMPCAVNGETVKN